MTGWREREKQEVSKEQFVNKVLELAGSIAFTVLSDDGLKKINVPTLLAFNKLMIQLGDL